MSVAVDLHMDTPTASLGRDDFSLDQRNPQGHVDLPRLREGGLSGAFFACWVEPRYQGVAGASFARAVELLDRTVAVVERTPGVRVVRSVSELHSAVEEGDFGVFLAVEGGHAVEGSVQRMGELADLGIRYMTLTWNHPNEWADACCSPPVHGGLTAHGREMVRAMGRRGVFPDLSHASDETFWDTMDVSTLPPLVSHSCSRRLVDHPRNVTDEMAREVAARGGILGVNFFPGFVDADFKEAMGRIEAHAAAPKAGAPMTGPAAEGSLRGREGGAAARDPDVLDRRTAALRELPRPPLESLVDHFHHLADLAGPQYLALGSDFDGVATLPEGMDDVSFLPALGDRLRTRGFSRDEVDGIFGGNFLRMLKGADE